MRLAAIDIGTNSVHMIVVQVRPDFSFEIIDQEKEMVRLGAGGLDGRRLTDAAVRAALMALSKFRRLADSHRVDEILASATSATREAENGGEFLAAIQAETGIHAKVISGTEEARLIHLAAMYGVNVGTRSAVVIDIGGGSVEITLGTAERLRMSRSFKIGVIRMTERLVKSDPLSDRDERRLVRTITDAIEPYASAVAKSGFARAIGTSGTILSLGQMAAFHATGHEPAELRNLRVPASEIHQLRKRVVGLDLRQRLRLPGLDPKRGDIVVAGAVLLDTILRRLGATELTLCDLALREGLILDYIRKNRTQITQVDQYPDPRRRSVIELAERCRYFPEHAQQVARLSLSLFDQTRGTHGSTDREREWLEYAALLHDIGGHISYDKHHRHSHYLITNGDLRGFDPDEIAVIALVARYHRRSPPSKTHRDYARLPAASRRTVRVLSAILRLAEGLDRSHSSAIADAVVTDRTDDCLVQLKTDGDAELEVWTAPKHAGPFERVLGKRVSFAVSPATNPSAARLAAAEPDTKSVGAPAPNKASQRRRGRVTRN